MFGAATFGAATFGAATSGATTSGATTFGAATSGGSQNSHLRSNRQPVREPLTERWGKQDGANTYLLTSIGNPLYFIFCSLYITAQNIVFSQRLSYDI